MSKHTPGPWRYKLHRVDCNYMLITCSDDPQEGDNLRGYCGEANARLIAAAPDLLEALQDLFGADMEHVLMGDGKDDQVAAIAKAHAAIAKATGEKP